VKFEAKHFCGPVTVPDFNQYGDYRASGYKFASEAPFNNCVGADQENTHAFQVEGDTGNTNTLWQCRDCKKYSAEAPVLTRENGRVGCGMYARHKQNAENTFTGPLTNKHSALSSRTGEMIASLQAFFIENQDNITEWIHTRLAEDEILRDKVYYDQGEKAFFWYVNSHRTAPLSEPVQRSYREFGEQQNAEAVGGANGHVAAGMCSDNELPDAEVQDGCRFQSYNAKTAALNSAYLLRDIEDGCLADAADQEHIEKNTCNPNITKDTVDRVRDFTQRVHEGIFGLKLPLVEGEGGTAQTKVAPRSKINWVDGVLPFYAARPRNKGNSKDADYMAYLLDNSKRCEDTYLHKSLRDFACYFDSDDKVQIVVPWLGKDYAFLQKENRDRVRGSKDFLGTDLEKSQVGVDMCHNYERVDKKIPCAATTCLGSIDDEVYNQSMCFHSTKHDKYYLQELPNKVHLEFLKRYHLDNNLFNPNATHSQCYIKYTPYQKQLEQNRLCGHMQAPLGYSPVQIRARTRVAQSLNRTKVSIAASRFARDEFQVSKRRYSSLWAGDIAQSVLASSNNDPLQNKDDLVRLWPLPLYSASVVCQCPVGRLKTLEKR